MLSAKLITKDKSKQLSFMIVYRVRLEEVCSIITCWVCRMARVFRILIMKPALTNGEVMITLKLSKKAGYMKSTLNSDNAIDFRTVYSKKVN